MVTANTIWGPAPLYFKPICWHDNWTSRPCAQSPSSHLCSARHILHWLPLRMEENLHKLCQDASREEQQMDITPGIPAHDGTGTGSSAHQSPNVGLTQVPQREGWRPSRALLGNLGLTCLPQAGVMRAHTHAMLGPQILIL